jgi:glycosyltransferase involved in cell wall biosynthesis
VIRKLRVPVENETNDTGADLDEEHLPSVSVVIASYRGPERVGACLEGLTAQDYPRDRFEVVVVDDGSPVPLAPRVEEFAAELRVSAHRQGNAGPAVARNAGAQRATGELLAFTDDDCVPASDWVRRLAAALLVQPDALVGGTVRNLLRHDRYAEATHDLIAFLDATYGDACARRFFTSSNIAVARAEFLAVGGFDETFPVPGGEDRELCERWSAEGRPLARARHAVVWHAHGMTFGSFVRQHRNYGRGAYQVRHRRTAGDDRGISPEPLGFYLRLVADPFGRLPVGPALRQSALLAVAQVATVAGYVAEWRRSR